MNDYAPRELKWMVEGWCDMCHGLCKLCRGKSRVRTVWPRLNMGWQLCQCPECADKFAKIRPCHVYETAELEEEFGKHPAVMRSSGNVERNIWVFEEPGYVNENGEIIVYVFHPEESLIKSVTLRQLRSWYIHSSASSSFSATSSAIPSSSASATSDKNDTIKK